MMKTGRDTAMSALLAAAAEAARPVLNAHSSQTSAIVKTAEI